VNRNSGRGPTPLGGPLPLCALSTFAYPNATLNTVCCMLAYRSRSSLDVVDVEMRWQTTRTEVQIQSFQFHHNGVSPARNSSRTGRASDCWWHAWLPGSPPPSSSWRLWQRPTGCGFIIRLGCTDARRRRTSNGKSADCFESAASSATTALFRSFIVGPFSLQNSLKPCPHCRSKVRLYCRRKVRLSQKTARQRRQSHFSATVSLVCDSLTFLRQCGQALTVHYSIIKQY